MGAAHLSGRNWSPSRMSYPWRDLNEHDEQGATSLSDHILSPSRMSLHLCPVAFWARHKWLICDGIENLSVKGLIWGQTEICIIRVGAWPDTNDSFALLTNNHWPHTFVTQMRFLARYGRQVPWEWCLYISLHVHILILHIHGIADIGSSDLYTPVNIFFNCIERLFLLNSSQLITCKIYMLKSRAESIARGVDQFHTYIFKEKPNS